jgi:major vault protein
MLLPDPREEVIVRRALSDQQCALWYPENQAARDCNQRLRSLAQHAPTTRTGAVSEGQVRRSRKGKPGRKNVQMESTVMASSSSNQDSPAIMADQFSRGSTYTQPRTITLHTRFAGVPVIQVWTGYAVMVVSKDGQRRVQVGPGRVLLAYDEELEVLTASQGMPRGDQPALRSPYLKVQHNELDDRVEVETRDHVVAHLEVALRVDFEGDPERWFSVENYVQLLCDRARRALKAAARRVDAQVLYSDPDALVRQALLGQGEQPGLSFPENGMRVVDAEARGLRLADKRIADLLGQARHQSVRAGIELDAAQRKLAVDQSLEEISRQLATAQAQTARHRAELESQQVQRELTLTLARLASSIKEHQERLEMQRAKDAVADAGHLSSLERKQKNAALDREIAQNLQAVEAARLEAQTQATVARLAAVQDGFSEALLALGNQETLIKVADAMSVQKMLGGRDLPEVIGNVFQNTPLEDILERVQGRAAPKE